MGLDHVVGPKPFLPSRISYLRYYVQDLFTSVSSGCNATFYGKTKQYFKVSFHRYLGISFLIGKKVKNGNKLTATKGINDFKLKYWRVF